MKLGVITDGISDGVNRDLEHALQVDDPLSLTNAQLFGLALARLNHFHAQQTRARAEALAAHLLMEIGDDEDTALHAWVNHEGTAALFAAEQAFLGQGRDGPANRHAAEVE